MPRLISYDPHSWNHNDSLAHSFTRRNYMLGMTDLDLLASAILAAVWSGAQSQNPSKQDSANMATVAVVIGKNRHLFIAGNGFPLKDKIFDKKTQISTMSLPEFNRLYEVRGRENIVAIRGSRDSKSKHIGTKTHDSYILTEIGTTDSPESARYEKTTYRARFANNSIVYNIKNGIQEIITLSLNDIPPDQRPLHCSWIGNPNQYNKHAEMILRKYINGNSALFYDKLYIGVSKPCCMKCKTNLDINNIGYTYYCDTNPDKWDEPDDLDINTVQLW